MTASRVFLALFMVVLGNGSWASYEKDDWVVSEDYGKFHVVVSPDASPSEKFAASEFVSYWKQTTGHEASCSAEPGAEINVWVGREGVPQSLIGQVEFEDVGEEGFLLRTRKRGDSRKIKSDHLLIIGGSQRGTLYGVYQFFEDIMGMRWLTPDVTHIPQSPPLAIREMDFKFKPPLRYRDTNYYAFVHNPKFALVNRLNGHFADLPPEWGGHIKYGRDGFSHTFHQFVSPEVYAASHPEYFSEIGGVRKTYPAGTQLDLTNPEVLELVKKKTNDLLQDAPPDDQIVSFTQMDWSYWNESWPQKAIDELEESPSGSLVRFVNEVAESIELSFPGAYIDTFAYMFTRKPPRHIKPRDNVIIRLCSIECDFGRPLFDSSSKVNRAFRKDLQAWARKAKNLYVWDYTQNFDCFQGPHPNVQVLQPNIKFFADNGVQGVFEEAAHSPHSDFDALKGYILAHALWNPKVDWKRLYDEFLSLYYREAAPFIHEYLNLITHKVQKDNYPLTIFSKMEWVDYETVVTAEEIFHRAFDSVTDPEIRSRLEEAHVAVQYAALVCPPRILAASESYVLARPPSPSLEEYWQTLVRMGVTHTGSETIEQFKDQFGGQTPPRQEEVRLVRLENPYVELWLTPSLAGSVQRWRDKGSNTELLKGFEQPLSGKSVWREWITLNPDRPDMEKPFSGEYDLLHASTQSVTVQASQPNGLVLTRTMTLDPGSPRLDVALEVRNTSPQAVVPWIRIRPLFWMQGGYRPDLWVEGEKGWSGLEMTRNLGSEIAEAAISAKGLKRWAARIPGKGVVVLNSFQENEVVQLHGAYNSANELLDFDLCLTREPIPPGETVEVHTSYELLDRLPDEALVKTE